MNMIINTVFCLIILNHVLGSCPTLLGLKLQVPPFFSFLPEIPSTHGGVNIIDHNKVCVIDVLVRLDLKCRQQIFSCNDWIISGTPIIKTEVLFRCVNIEVQV